MDTFKLMKRAVLSCPLQFSQTTETLKFRDDIGNDICGINRLKGVAFNDCVNYENKTACWKKIF